MQDDTRNTPLPWIAPTPPAPVSELAYPWRAVILLDHTPLCPICADALTPGDIDTIKGVACCQLCSTRARASNWPEPYDFSHLFEARDLELQAGIRWYHPHDNRQETAFSRHERLESETLHAAPEGDLPHLA